MQKKKIGALLPCLTRIYPQNIMNYIDLFLILFRNRGSRVKVPRCAATVNPFLVESPPKADKPGYLA